MCKGGELERRTALVTVLTVIPPTARRTNLNNTDTFSHGEIEYELYCDVDGRPLPELTWYKVSSVQYRTVCMSENRFKGPVF